MVVVGPRDLILIEQVVFYAISRAWSIMKEHSTCSQLIFTFQKKDWNSFRVAGVLQSDRVHEELGQIGFIPEGMAVRDLFEIVMWKVAASLVPHGLEYKGYEEDFIGGNFRFSFTK